MIRLLTHRWTHFCLLLLVLATALWMRQQDPDWIKSLRYAVFDAYNKVHPRVSNGAVVVVDIDEGSLRDDRLGQWPWPRTDVARLVDRLHAMGARAIVFDMVFAEQDRTSPHHLAEHLPDEMILEGFMDLPDHDDVLADSFRHSERVVTGFIWSNNAEATRQMPVLSRKIAMREAAEDIFVRVPVTAGVTTNIPVLEQAAAGNGGFGVTPEVDGIIRQVPLFFRFQDAQGHDVFFPSLALEALRVAEDPRIAHKIRALKPQEMTLFSPGHVLATGAYRVPFDSDARFYVQFARFRSDVYVPAWKVFLDDFDPARVTGKIVLIGTSAEGLKDIRSTPLDLYVPGVEVHRNIIEQILDNRFLQRPRLMHGAELIYTGVIGLAVLALAPFINTLVLGLVGVLLSLIVFVLSYFSYLKWGVLIDPVYSSLTILGIYFLSSILSYIRTESERRSVRKAFGLYISPDYMKELIGNAGALKLGGETRTLSILFADIRGFATISESLTPAQMIQLMNDFLTPMSDVVLAQRGTIDKYIGDAMMAFWNAPLNDPDHARHACRAALGIRAALIDVNTRLAEKAQAEGGAPIVLRVGIGINTGDAAVGNMGSRQRFAYSALGDAVNLAARLEGQTKTYGVDLIIGEDTYAQIQDFACIELDLLRVKGRREPVRIFTIIGENTLGGFKEVCAQHRVFLEAYRAQEWDNAHAALQVCLAHDFKILTAYYQIMDQRIADLRAQNLPPDWDGVYNALTK